MSYAASVVKSWDRFPTHGFFLEGADSGPFRPTLESGSGRGQTCGAIELSCSLSYSSEAEQIFKILVRNSGVVRNSRFLADQKSTPN